MNLQQTHKILTTFQNQCSSPTALKPKQAVQTNTQAEINILMHKLDSFTQNLETKVNGLLQQQQQQFFQAYKGYLADLRKTLSQMELKIEQQKNKICEYENEGEQAKLVQKNIAYERQLNKMYDSLSDKERQIQQEKVKNEVLQKTNRQLLLSLKELLKERARNKMKLLPDEMVDETKPMESLLFATEVKQSDRTHQQTFVRDQSPLRHASLSKRTPYFDADYLRLKRQVSTLRHKNAQLIKVTTDVNTNHAQLQSFFLRCVEQIKKHICTRNNVPSCSLEDFKKEDKLKLLMWVISNDEVIRALHSVLFKNSSPLQKTLFGRNPAEAIATNSSNPTVYINLPKTIRNNSMGMVKVPSEEDERTIYQALDVRVVKRKPRRASNYMTTKKFSEFC